MEALKPASHSNANRRSWYLTSRRGERDMCDHWEVYPVLGHLGLHRTEAKPFQYNLTPCRCCSVNTLEKSSPVLEDIVLSTTVYQSPTLTYCSVKIHTGFFSFPFHFPPGGRIFSPGQRTELQATSPGI